MKKLLFLTFLLLAVFPMTGYAEMSPAGGAEGQGDAHFVYALAAIGGLTLVLCIRRRDAA